MAAMYLPVKAAVTVLQLLSFSVIPIVDRPFTSLSHSPCEGDGL